MEKGVSNQIYNIGTGNAIKVRDLVNKVFSQELISADVLEENNSSSNMIKKSIANISKIIKLKK